MRELGVPWPFTDWTPSGFWSPQGLTTEAPVFSRRPQLPTMLGQFVHTLPLFRLGRCPPYWPCHCTPLTSAWAPQHLTSGSS